MKQMKTCGLAPRPAPPFPGLAVGTTVDAVRAFVSPKCLKINNKPKTIQERHSGYYGRQHDERPSDDASRPHEYTLIGTRVNDEVKRVLNSLDGLDLEEYL